MLCWIARACCLLASHGPALLQPQWWWLVLHSRTASPWQFPLRPTPLDQPSPEQLPLHTNTARPVNTGAAPSSPHTTGQDSCYTARPASTRAAPSIRHTTRPDNCCIGHEVVHHKVTSGQHITSKFQKLVSKKLVVAKSEFKQLEEDSMIQ
jgi:hypothetical protein